MANSHFLSKTLTMWHRLALLAGLAVLSPIATHAGVGVSINVGEPGFYGQIAVGDAPPPELIYPQPVWIERGPAYIEPIYLRVPIGYERNWRYYCGRYHACNRPVYFVRDSWYSRIYAPYYRQRYWHEDHPGWYRDHDNGWHQGWDHDHGEHRDWDHGDRGEHRVWDHAGSEHVDHGDRR